MLDEINDAAFVLIGDFIFFVFTFVFKYHFKIAI